MSIVHVKDPGIAVLACLFDFGNIQTSIYK